MSQVAALSVDKDTAADLASARDEAMQDKKHLKESLEAANAEVSRLVALVEQLEK